MSPDPPGIEGAHAGDATLVDIVRVLRYEIRGLRSASQFRAVIEQAKGVLVERHHITLDEAFDRLRTMSQEHNVRLVEVAATVVGVAIPGTTGEAGGWIEESVLGRLPDSSHASGAWRALRRQPGVQAGVASALIDAVASATSRGDEAAHLVVELLALQDVAAATIYRVAEDGSLRLVGHHGVPGDVISSWRSIPPLPQIPYIRAVRDSECFFWGDKAARAAQFPSVGDGQTAFMGSAVIPVLDGATVIGVVGLLWEEVQEFDPERTAGIARTVQQIGPLLLRSAAAEDPELEWLTTLLSLHLDPWLVLEVASVDLGAIREFVVVDVALQLAGASEWVGRQMIEIWPSASRDGVAQALAVLAASGGAWNTTVDRASDAPWGVPGTFLRAVRLGRRIVLVWRPGHGARGRQEGDDVDAHEGQELA